MAFTSNTSKAKAKATVNKLFGSMLSGAVIETQPKKNASATEKFTQEIKKKKLTRDEIRRANKIEKVKRNKIINTKLEKDKKFQKLVKYNVIKSHKLGEKLSPEEEKYLKKLIKKNTNAIKKVSDVDDPFVKEEIEDLRKEIIALTNEKYHKSRDRKLDAKLESFNEKVKKGVLSYPGLTPGLAPVGYDDSDDE